MIQIHILNGKQCRSRSVGFFSLDLHCLQRQSISGISRTRVTKGLQLHLNVVISKPGQKLSKSHTCLVILCSYVHDNYYDFPVVGRQAPSTTSPTPTTTPPETTTHINWVSYLYKTMTADYVPLELFKGLVACGKEYSMFAIDAPVDLRKALNVDYGSVPGLGFGNTVIYYHWTLYPILEWINSSPPPAPIPPH